MDKTEVQTPDVSDAIPIPGSMQIHHIKCLADKKELKLMKNSPYKNTDESVFRTASYETNTCVSSTNTRKEQEDQIASQTENQQTVVSTSSVKTSSVVTGVDCYWRLLKGQIRIYVQER